MVSRKDAGVETPATLAVTWYEPATLLAVKAGAVAMPEPSVIAVVMPPAKLPLAPNAGAVKVTVALDTGLLPESSTWTCRPVRYVVKMVALCGVPAVAVIVAGAPERLATEKLAGLAAPAVLALTL